MFIIRKDIIETSQVVLNFCQTVYITFFFLKVMTSKILLLLYFWYLLNNIIKKKLMERTKVGHGSL